MLISKDSFTGELYIEGLAGNTTSANLQWEKVESIMERRETEFLKSFLGELYEPFIEFIDGELDEESPYFTLYEYLTGDSPIAYYVYFHYVRYVNSAVTQSGVRKDTANAYDPKEKLVCSWNRMVDINREIDAFLKKEFKGNYKPNKYLLMYINSLGV